MFRFSTFFGGALAVAVLALSPSWGQAQQQWGTTGFQQPWQQWGGPGPQQPWQQWGSPGWQQPVQQWPQLQQQWQQPGWQQPGFFSNLGQRLDAGLQRGFQDPRGTGFGQQRGTRSPFQSPFDTRFHPRFRR